MYGSNCLFNGCEPVVEIGLLSIVVPLARERHASSLGLLLKMRILEVAPLVVALPMVMPPSLIKPVLVLNLILV